MAERAAQAAGGAASMAVDVISVREAARRLKRTPDTLEQGLRAGTFPVGTAYRLASGRFVYIIPKLAFERFLRGELAGRNAAETTKRKARREGNLSGLCGADL